MQPNPPKPLFVGVPGLAGDVQRNATELSFGTVPIIDTRRGEFVDTLGDKGNSIPGAIKLALNPNLAHRRAYVFIQATVTNAAVDWKLVTELALYKAGRPVVTLPVEIGNNTNGTAGVIGIGNSLVSMFANGAAGGLHAISIVLADTITAGQKSAILTPNDFSAVADSACLNLVNFSANVSQWQGFVLLQSSNVPF